MKKIVLSLFLVHILASFAVAAESFPRVATGEADFAEGDLVKSRQEGKEAALRGAVLEALKAEAGPSVVDDDPLEVKTKFTKPYADFIKRSGVLGETKAGMRLFVTVGYELDLNKLKARVAGAKFTRAEPKLRIGVLWVEENRTGEPEAAGAEARALAGYKATSFTAGAAVPPAAQALITQLSANGYNWIPMGDSVRDWALTALGNQEVSKQFLRELAARMDVKSLVYLRIVRRDLEGPPAAHFKVGRLNHVAFVLDAAKGEFTGKPVASPVVEVKGEGWGTGYEVPPDWLNRLLDSLMLEKRVGATLVITGIRSPGVYDGVVKRLRKNGSFSEITPRVIAAERVEFELPGERPNDEWLQAVGAALPEAAVTSYANGVTAALPKAFKP